MSTNINISDLPQVTEINNDDLIFIQTPTASNTIEFKNFVIGLDNTTFGTTIQRNSTNVNALSSLLYNNNSNPITETGSATHGLPIVINGTTYRILLHEV